MTELYSFDMYFKINGRILTGCDSTLKKYDKYYLLLRYLKSSSNEGIHRSFYKLSKVNKSRGIHSFQYLGKNICFINFHKYSIQTNFYVLLWLAFHNAKLSLNGIKINVTMVCNDW